MDSKPLVSVIVPIYNVEPYLRDCLTSLTAQTLDNIEIICVNDGSTDRSQDVIEEFASQDKRIVVVTQKNAGVSAARNAGLARVRAELIQFCDPDDWFAPDMCRKLYDAITQNGTDLAMCGISISYEGDVDDRKKKEEQKYYELQYSGTCEVTRDMIQELNVSLCNKIFRKSIADRYAINFPDGHWYEDAYFCSAYFVTCKTIYFLNDELYHYRRRPGSIMSSTYESNIRALDHMIIAEKLHGFLKQNNLFEQNRQYFWRLYVNFISFSFVHVPDHLMHLLYNPVADFVSRQRDDIIGAGEELEFLLDQALLGNFPSRTRKISFLSIPFIRIKTSLKRKTCHFLGIKVYRKRTKRIHAQEKDTSRAHKRLTVSLLCGLIPFRGLRRKMRERYGRDWKGELLEVLSDRLDDLGTRHKKNELLTIALDEKISRLENCIQAVSTQLTEIAGEIMRVLEKQNKLLAPGSLAPRCGSNGFSDHDRSRRQILVIGFYGAPNYGDELMLAILLAQLRNRHNIQISVIFQDNPSYNLNQWKGIFAYTPPSSQGELVNMADWFDEIILGGGAHIDDKPVRHLSHIPYLAMVLSELMIERGKDVQWIAVSSNQTLEDRTYIGRLAAIISKAERFSLRDPNSIDSLTGAGVDVSRVLLENDLALHFDPDKKTLGVTLLNYFDNLPVLLQFCREIKQYVDQSPYCWTICLLPFYNDAHMDRELYDALLHEMDWGDTDIFIATEYDNTETMLTFMKSLDMAVNMRYHASLITMKYGIATITICYDVHEHYFNKITYAHKLFNDNHLLYYSRYSEGDLLSMMGDFSFDPLLHE